MSWLSRAELSFDAEDTDAAFINCWIAFNAVYAAEKPMRLNFPTGLCFLGIL